MTTPAHDELARERADAEGRRVFGRPIDSVEGLEHSKLTGGVWRVDSGGETAILKILQPLPTDVLGDLHGDVRGHFRYWPREALAYDGWVPDTYLRAGVRPPRMLARFDRGEGEIAMWLEDVRGIRAPEWEMARYAEFGERLGRAQGSYVAGAALPGETWLCRDFMRQYLAERDTHIEFELLESDEAWSQPQIARHFGTELRRELVRLHAERDRFLAMLDASPRTVAHLDVWSGNLFETGDSTVLIDWAFAGIAAAGEDIGNLVPDSVFDFQCPPSALEPLDRNLFGGYMRGVRAAGWTGDDRLIRLGMCASAVKYEWIAAATLRRAMTDSATQSIYGGGEVDADAFFAVRAAVMSFLVAWADEARSIARSLGLS